MPSRPHRRAGPDTRRAPQRRELAALEVAKRRVRRHPGVVGVDYGYIYEDGVRTDRIGIRFHVRAKLPAAALASQHRLPRRIEGLRTDVLESGFHPHRADPFVRADILQPGLSIGNVPRQSDGTLGTFVRDRHGGSLCILSNWHVLCGGTEARVGDEISQPGPLFLGPNPARATAQLRRWVPPARQYDAAIASLVPEMQVDATLLDGGLRIAGMTEPQVGMTVVKSGAATGLTHALVDAVGGHYQVPYDDFGDTSRWMAGIHLVPHPQFQDRDVSLPGDSGAVWVEVESGKAVALNFAGEDDGGPLNEYALGHSLPELSQVLEFDIAD
jgi:hypothetical protein